MASKAFEMFLWSCFDNSFHAVHDGLDVPSLMELTGEEKEDAGRRILEALPVTEDIRPIEAAGYLRLVKSKAALTERIHSEAESDMIRLWAAWALFQIEPGMEYIEILTNLRDHADPFLMDENMASWCLNDCKKKWAEGSI